MNDATDSPCTVSVVVPCKNDARFLPANLESILSQDYPHIECIVVDGGSIDATLDLLERYGDRIRWVSEPDRGSFDAINRGWKLATGDILTWLNADDVWVPGAARAAVELLQRRTDVDVVYGTVGVVDELGRVHGDLIPRAWDVEYALRHCDHILFQAGAFMRRAILERVGWLYPAWCHDHDLWLRIARAGGTFASTPQRLAMERLRSDNLGNVADVVIPGKIQLTRRFFQDPALPDHLRRLRRRAISASYLRSIDYLQPGKARHWAWFVTLMTQAVLADPTNVDGIVERGMRPLRGRFGTLRSRTRERLARARAQRPTFRSFRLSIGRGLRSVFSRRSDGMIVARVDQLQASMEQMRAAAAQQLHLLQQNQARFDAVVEGLSRDRVRLTTALELHEAERDELRRALAAQEREYERLRKALASQRPHDEPRPRRVPATAKLTDAVRDVYGAPPTLRTIPGWNTYWGTDDSSPLLRTRAGIWSSLKAPVIMRWFDELLVTIHPGNELSRVLFLTGNFEPNELTWLSGVLTEGMTVLDVGAHMGLYSMFASKLVGESGTVVAMEPSRREFQRLVFQVGLNELGNVRCLNEAASDVNGEATLKIAAEWNSGHNTLGEFTSSSVEALGEERVRTKTIDTLVSAERLERLDVIKIDAEGHEAKVLCGATETLTRFRPRILIEVFGEALVRQGATVERVLGFLEQHRYELYEPSATGGELVSLSREFGSGSRNVIAIPR
ncbi:MAG TPA: FkbM family methyltransferase [Vicinamibacterales bacterium]|nr:FkbM family methyltransferase [Vicinamibacterales bacterium]